MKTLDFIRLHFYFDRPQKNGRDRNHRSPPDVRLRRGIQWSHPYINNYSDMNDVHTIVIWYLLQAGSFLRRTVTTVITTPSHFSVFVNYRSTPISPTPQHWNEERNEFDVLESVGIVESIEVPVLVD